MLNNIKEVKEFDIVMHSMQKHKNDTLRMQKSGQVASVVLQGMHQDVALCMAKSVVSVENMTIIRQCASQYICISRTGGQKSS